MTEQDYRNIIAKMRVDPLFRNLVMQIVRDNIGVLSAPIVREVEQKIAQVSSDKRTYY